MRQEDGSFFVLLAICTHLGCTPNWFAMDHEFKCPYRGSRFHRDGINDEGPAPRPLDRVKISKDAEGQLVGDTDIGFRMGRGAGS